MSVQILSDRIVSSTEATRDFGKLLNEAQKQPLFIMRHNKPEAILIGMKAYEALQQQLEMLQDQLDHMLLYVELKTRKQESGEEITLEELATKYRL